MSKTKRWMILTGSVSGLLASAVLVAIIHARSGAPADMTDGSSIRVDGSQHHGSSPIRDVEVVFQRQPLTCQPIKTFARQAEDLVRMPPPRTANHRRKIRSGADRRGEWASGTGCPVGMGLGGPSIVLGPVAECGSVQSAFPSSTPADDSSSTTFPGSSRLQPEKPVVACSAACHGHGNHS